MEAGARSGAGELEPSKHVSGHRRPLRAPPRPEALNLERRRMRAERQQEGSLQGWERRGGGEQEAAEGGGAVRAVQLILLGGATPCASRATTSSTLGDRIPGSV